MAMNIINDVNRLQNNPEDVYNDLNDMIKRKECSFDKIINDLKTKTTSIISKELKKSISLIYSVSSSNMVQGRMKGLIKNFMTLSLITAWILHFRVKLEHRPIEENSQNGKEFCNDLQHL